VINCEANQNKCKNCFISPFQKAHKCQLCNTKACDTEHLFQHVKKCREFMKNNMCGFEDEIDNENEFRYRGKGISSEVLHVLGQGKIQKKYFCNKISQNLKKCGWCQSNMCPNCYGSTVSTNDFNRPASPGSFRQADFCRDPRCNNEQNQALLLFEI